MLLLATATVTPVMVLATALAMVTVTPRVAPVMTALWRTASTGAEGATLVEDTTPGISFSAGEMRFQAGCNQHFGEVTFEGDVLLVQGFGSTLIGCDAAVDEQENWFADFFLSSPTVSIDGDRVTFTTSDVTLVFLDDIANPAPPLVGTVWEMTAFIDGEIAFGGSFDSPAMVTFGGDGVAHVFTGCNTGELTYEYDDSTINFGPGTGYTEAGCSDMADVEQHVQMIFRQGEVTYSFNRQDLVIERGDIGACAALRASSVEPTRSRSLLATASNCEPKLSAK